MVEPAQALNNTLAPVEPRHPFGLMPNRAHQAPRGLFDMGLYALAIVEFDDQGRCYDRAQMDAVTSKLDTFADLDAIIVVFVHGWKHDARSDDDNLANFQTVLRQTVEHEATQAGSSGHPRPVLGVFVGWRGMSWYDTFGVTDNLTFWGRQHAGQRVAVGSVRELFGRFRHYRNRRKDGGGAPLLVIVGHSFGGMIVYSALAQSLIEAATPLESEVKPRFADLVLLVNPAFEAERYLPVHDLVQLRLSAGKGTNQPSVFVAATAANDWATGIFFPIGNWLWKWTQSYRGREEWQAAINTMGHVAWMKTHDLDSAAGGSGYRLSPASAESSWNPFWIVRATPAIIDGHNDIFGTLFLSFVADLVFRHVEFSRSARALRSMG